MAKSKALIFFVLNMLMHVDLGSALAATYYVTKSGLDSSPCAQTSPCRSIAQGVSKAKSPGDTVIVGAGTYVESVVNWNSGVTGNPITVKANPGDNVIWRAPSTNLNDYTGPVSINNSSYIRIEGFRFEGSVTKSTIRVMGPVGAKDKGSNVLGIEIINNSFINNGNNGIDNGANPSRTIYLQSIGYGSSYSGGPVNTISGNQFNSNYGSDIWLLESSDTHISDNLSVNLKSSQSLYSGNSFMTRSMHFGGGSNRNLVERNAISLMSKDAYVTTEYTASGLRLDAGSSNNIFQDNIVHDLDFANAGNSSGIYPESGCNNNLIQRNIVYNIGSQGLRDGSPNTNPAMGNNWINNVIFGCKGEGLRMSNAKNTIVKNNIFLNNNNDQIYVTAQSVGNGGHAFRNNNYFKTGTANIGYWNAPVNPTPANLTLSQWNAASGEKNSLSVDPGFLNPPTDFHLKSNSLVKGAGEGGVDMGAYPLSVQSAVSIPTGFRIVQ